MGREYSTKSPRQIREEEGIGLNDANRLAKTSGLLDRVEKATTVKELRALVAEFITLQTGIK